MNLIALVDKKWGIANKGRELVDIPEDKKLFRIVRMYMSSVVDRYTKNSFHIVIQHILQRLITLTKQILI